MFRLAFLIIKTGFVKERYGCCLPATAHGAVAGAARQSECTAGDNTRQSPKSVSGKVDGLNLLKKLPKLLEEYRVRYPQNRPFVISLHYAYLCVSGNAMTTVLTSTDRP